MAIRSNPANSASTRAFRACCWSSGVLRSFQSFHAMNAVQAFPSTAFYDSKGELVFVHQGGYSSEDKLAEDIERYAR